MAHVESLQDAPCGDGATHGTGTDDANSSFGEWFVGFEFFT